MNNLIKYKIQDFIINNNINYNDLSNDDLLIFTYYLFIKSDYFQDRNNFFLIKDKFDQYDIINFDMENLYDINLNIEKSSIVYDHKMNNFIDYNVIYFSNDWIEKIKQIKNYIEISENYKDLSDLFLDNRDFFSYFEYFLKNIINEEKILQNFENVFDFYYSHQDNKEIKNYKLNNLAYLGVNCSISPFDFKVRTLFEKTKDEIIKIVLNPNYTYIKLQPYLEDPETFNFLFRENTETIDINSATFKKIKESKFYKNSILSYIIESTDINKNNFINNFSFKKDKEILTEKINDILKQESDLSLMKKHLDKINPILHYLLQTYNNKNNIKIKKIKNLNYKKRENFIKKIELFSQKTDIYSKINGNIEKYFSNSDCEYFLYNNYEIISSFKTKQYYKNKLLKYVYFLNTNFHFLDNNDLNEKIKESILDIIKNKEKNEILVFSSFFDKFVIKNKQFFQEIAKENVIILEKSLFSHDLIKWLKDQEITESLYEKLLAKNNILKYIKTIEVEEKDKKNKTLKLD